MTLFMGVRENIRKMANPANYYILCDHYEVFQKCMVIKYYAKVLTIAKMA